MSNYSLEAVAKRTDGTDTSWIALGGGLTFDSNGKLKIDTTSASSSFRMYVNATTGVTYDVIDPEQISSVGGKNEFTQKFKNITDCILWIRNNVGSEKGTTDIILETNVTLSGGNSPFYTDPGMQQLRIWGNKAAYQKQYGLSTVVPSTSETRKEINLVAGTGINNIPVYCNSNVEFVLVKFRLNTNANQYAWMRANLTGTVVDFMGCKLTVDHASGITVSHGFQAEGGQIRFRPFQANWLTGLARNDPFQVGAYTAPMEIENCKVYALLAAGNGGTINIIEYQYHSYGTGAYTYPARIHFTNNATMYLFCYLEAASSFGTNGACATKNGTVTVYEAGIKAVAFCPIIPQQTQPSGSIGGAGVWPVIPGSGYSGTANVDYRVKAGTSLTFTTNLNNQLNYPR